MLMFVTGNKHKFSEAERILKGHNIMITHNPIGYEEIRSDDCAAVASAGAKYCYGKVKKPLFVEDSGLFIDKLNGFPGAYSSWVNGKIGIKGILKLMEGEKDRRAAFKTVVAYADGKGIKTFVGVCKGSIAERAIGKGGFGYDPIFIPEGFSKTFSQNTALKGCVSHRRKALEKLAEYLKR